MSAHTAATLGIVPLRHGPGQEYPVQHVLAPGTHVVIVSEADDWMEVSSPAGQGFLSRHMLLLPEQQVRAGFLTMAIEQAANGISAGMAAAAETADVASTAVALEPPAFLRLNLGASPTAPQKTVANTWNRYGGLLATLADTLKIGPGVAVAVFGIESGGRGFAQDGRMIIRFEAHIFFDQWGKRNLDRYNQHFRFNSAQRWKGHEWRPASNQPWRAFHDHQPTEWEVFEFARTLDDRAAKLSISMGSPQIMGFNHANIGYETVGQMFDAFSASDRNQVIGFFDFVKGPSGTSRKVIALQEHNFERFAELYNGTGKGHIYAGKMRQLFDIFQPAWGKVGIRRVSTAVLNLRSTPEISPDNILRELPQGTRVNLLFVEPVRTAERVWVNVRALGQDGWVSGAHLDPVFEGG